MSIDQIQRSMELNRRNLDRRVIQIRSDLQLTHTHRRHLLAECWFDAMRAHYRLLGEYLQIRNAADATTGWVPPRIPTAHLRAPQRPDELPEALSRYVTVTRHSKHSI